MPYKLRGTWDGTHINLSYSYGQCYLLHITWPHVQLDQFVWLASVFTLSPFFFACPRTKLICVRRGIINKVCMVGMEFNVCVN